MVVEDNALGSQPIEVRRLDPGVAVRPQEAEVQAVANNNDDIHESAQVGETRLRQLAWSSPPIVTLAAVNADRLPRGRRSRGA
jgi:hypothetical protein